MIYSLIYSYLSKYQCLFVVVNLVQNLALSRFLMLDFPADHGQSDRFWDFALSAAVIGQHTAADADNEPISRQSASFKKQLRRMAAEARSPLAHLKLQHSPAHWPPACFGALFVALIPVF